MVDTNPAALFLAANAFTKAALVEAPDERDWIGSVYAWLRKLKGRRMGSEAEKLVATFLANAELEVGASWSTHFDRLVNSWRVEMKCSMRWSDGTYAFQQIRDQDYDFVLMTGISPREISMWLVPKAVAMVISKPQHTGKDGQETRWLKFNTNNPPAELAPYGGRIELAEALVLAPLRMKPDAMKLAS